MKKLISISNSVCLSLVAMALTFASCDKEENGKTSLKFNPSDKVEVSAGKTVAITVSGGAEPYLVSSSDTKIAKASINKSTITIEGVAKGTASVVVTDKDKVSGKIAVTVKEGETLSFDKSSVEVDASKETVVTVTGGTAPYAAEAKDAAIATVSVKENKITVKGVKSGTTTVTVTDKEKKNSGTFTVKVK